MSTGKPIVDEDVRSRRIRPGYQVDDLSTRVGRIHVAEYLFGRHNSTMSITLKLDEEQSRRLVEVAQELNVDPTELAKAAISDLVSRASDDFEGAARRVLQKNQELYRRLS